MKLLSRSGAMMHPADVHRLDERGVDELVHRRDGWREQASAPDVGPVPWNRRYCVHRRVEEHLHARGHAHPVQLLLPIARRHRIVDEDDESDVLWLSPSDHDLTVDESIVDAIENETHAPPSWTWIARRPRSAACRAASTGVASVFKTKSSITARFAPTTSTASGVSRSSFLAAIVARPACRSLKITDTPLFR